MKLPSPFPCDRCNYMRWDCTCRPRSAAQHRAGAPVDPSASKETGEHYSGAYSASSDDVWEWPVLPALTVEERRAALDPIDTPEQAARSPWWPEEAA